jgi:hypothetical protein
MSPITAMRAVTPRSRSRFYEIGVRRLWSSAAGPLHHGTAHVQGADAVATERLTCS